MSRLAERFMGLDRGTDRPEGLGGIPNLTPGAPRRLNWSPAILLVMLVGMSLLAGAFLLRPRSVPPTATPGPTAVAAAAAPSPPMAPAAPPPAQALLDQGLVAAQRGALADAVTLFTRALDVDRGNAEAWNSLGVVLVLKGEIGPGVEAFRKAVRANPQHAEAQRNLAVALDRQGRSAEAVTHYRAFLRLAGEGHPAREDVRLRLAQMAVPQQGER